MAMAQRAREMLIVSRSHALRIAIPGLISASKIAGRPAVNLYYNVCAPKQWAAFARRKARNERQIVVIRVRTKSCTVAAWLHAWMEHRLGGANAYVAKRGNRKEAARRSLPRRQSLRWPDTAESARQLVPLGQRYA